MSGESVDSVFLKSLYETSPIASLVSASRRDPSYVPAAAFAEGVVEYLRMGSLQKQIKSLPEPLRLRVGAVVNNVGADITEIRADLEGWFDNAMERVSGLYKRWARWFVLGTTVVIVLIANVDAVRVAENLWETPALRAAVVEAAGDVGDPAAATPSNIEDVAADIGDLQELGIPVGWVCPDTGCGGVGDWYDRVADQAPSRALGWVLTILLVSLGAPFWYGLLTQLLSLRSSGSKPPAADHDPGSMTSMLASAESVSVVSGPELRRRAREEIREQSKAAAESAIAQNQEGLKRLVVYPGDLEGVPRAAVDEQAVSALGALLAESLEKALAEPPAQPPWESTLGEALTQSVRRID